MEGESCVTRSITEERHSWNIQRTQMVGGSGVIRRIMDELHPSDIQRN